MAFDGTDPTPALADAVALYEAGDFRAAGGGEYRAMHNLSLMLDAGEGAPRDPVEAVLWLRRAAEAGSGRSQAALGLAPDYEKDKARAMLEAIQAGRAWAATRRETAAGGAHAAEEELTATDVEALVEEARGLIEGRGWCTELSEVDLYVWAPTSCGTSISGIAILLRSERQT